MEDKTILFTTDAGDDILVESQGTASSGDKFYKLSVPDMLTKAELKKLAFNISIFCGNIIDKR